MQSFFVLFLSCKEVRIASEEPPAFLPKTASSGGCNSACSITERHISEEDWLAAFDKWTSQPIGEATIELETLLFYVRETRSWLAVHGSSLTEEQRAFLEHELSRDQIDIQMRIIDEYGQMRGTLQSVPIFLKEKQHIPFQGTGSLGMLETSGKVKRVGLKHLWSRW